MPVPRWFTPACPCWRSAFWAVPSRAACGACAAWRQAAVAAGRGFAGADGVAGDRADRAGPGDSDLQACAGSEFGAAQGACEGQLALVALEFVIARVERAAVAVAGQAQRGPTVYGADADRGEYREPRAEAEGDRDRRVKPWERCGAVAAVFVDRVACDLDRAGVNAGVAVVAVRGAQEAVAVAVEVDGVRAAAILVDAVLGDVGRARMDARVGIVAVARLGRPV